MDVMRAQVRHPNHANLPDGQAVRDGVPRIILPVQGQSDGAVRSSDQGSGPLLTVCLAHCNKLQG